MTYFTRFASGDPIPVGGLGSTAYDISESLRGKSSFMKMDNYLVDFSIDRFDILSDLTSVPDTVRITCDDSWMGYDPQRGQYYC